MIGRLKQARFKRGRDSSRMARKEIAALKEHVVFALKAIEEMAVKMNAFEEQLKALDARMTDLEYFRDHAKELLDIQEIQDS